MTPPRPVDLLQGIQATLSEVNVDYERRGGQLAQRASCNSTYLDNLLWLFCAQDYGNVCGNQPKCSLCALSTSCRYSQSVRVSCVSPQD